MTDRLREFDPKLDATGFINRYAAKLRTLATSSIANDPNHTHEHMIATKSVLLAYSQRLESIAKGIQAKHEFDLVELVQDIDDALNLRDRPIKYSEDMTAQQIVDMVAGSVYNDIRAFLDHLITKELEKLL